MADPYLLLSFINTKLRNNYKNLEDLCEDLSMDREKVCYKLLQIDYVYDELRNSFIKKSLFNDNNDIM